MTHEKEQRRKPENERGELLGLAVAAMGRSHRHHLKHRACQLSAAPSSLQTASTVLALALLASPATRAQQADKILHASASAAIVDVVWASAALCGQPLPVRLGAAVGVAAAAGVGKELVDVAGFGTPDAADLLFDAFGIGVGVAVALVVEALWPREAAVADVGASAD